MGVNNEGAVARARCAWALIAALLLCAMAFDALAMRKIEPGDALRLDPDEGLLVVSFETEIPVHSVRVERVGRVSASPLMKDVPAGRTVELYAAKAGRYRWVRVEYLNTDLWRFYYSVRKDAEFEFEVVAGKLNYPGDAIFGADDGGHLFLHLANRSLRVIDWMKSSHPQVQRQYPLAYNGHFPEPFPAFYEKETAERALPADPNAGLAPPPAGELPLPPALLWKIERIRDYSLSPDGMLAVLEVRDQDGGIGLDLIDLATASVQRLLTIADGFGTVEWESDRVLLVGVPERGQERLNVLRFGARAGDKLAYDALRGPLGRIVDLTPSQPDHILFQRSGNFRDVLVFPLRLDTQASLDQLPRTNARDRLNKGVTGDYLWLADGQGRLRVAFVWREDHAVMVHGLDGQFREVMEVENDREFAPVRLSYDGERLYGFSEKDRPQRDLVEFDPAQGKIVRTIFSRPGVDLAGALFDDKRNPIGVRYYESGRLVSHYFDEENAKLGALLQKAFPGRTVATLYRSRDARKFLLWVDDSDVPPQIFHLDLDRRKAELLDEFYPHLAGRKMAPTHAMKVKAADGTLIDAFLTLPPGDGRRPLVVMPHGGPVGIADVLHFNHDAQFVASLGYAVLRVNFRGSAGYGRKFEEAGRLQYGKGIEDDIDAAINAALASHPLDAGRMCVVGTSYGGYSALISTLRWPGRFRCAVSIAGVTDRALRFTASDGARSEEGRKLMIEAMGDPKADLDAMIAASPLYQYRKLTTPLMLVHGRDDFRVDFEHTRRLVRMLNLDGRPPVVLAIAGEGHGFAKLKSMAIVWTGIAGFLRQHLDAVPPAGPATLPAKAPAATPAMTAGAPPASGG